MTNLQEAETKLAELRTMWIKGSSKEIKAMAKAQYDKLLPQVERLRRDFFNSSIKFKR